MCNSLISIIVPVYNAEKYLQKCIDSIIKQTYTNIELILVDDGSTDSSGPICDEYAKKDARIKVIHQKNGGTVLARNAGLEQAIGKYWGFVDADDWIMPQMYEKMIMCMEEGNYDIVWCDVIIEKSGRQYISKSNSSENSSDLIGQLLIGKFSGWLWHKLFSADFYRKCNVFQDPSCSMGEDMLVMIQLLYNRPKLRHLKEALYCYNCNNENSLTTKPYSVVKDTNNKMHIEHFLREKGCYDDYRQDFLIYAMNAKLRLLNAFQFQDARKLYPEAHRSLKNYTIKMPLRLLYYMAFNAGKAGEYVFRIYRKLNRK